MKVAERREDVRSRQPCLDRRAQESERPLDDLAVNGREMVCAYTSRKSGLDCSITKMIHVRGHHEPRIELLQEFGMLGHRPRC